jgi:hypothetical protein
MRQHQQTKTKDLSTADLQGFKLQSLGSVLNEKPGSSLAGNQQRLLFKRLRGLLRAHDPLARHRHQGRRFQKLWIGKRAPFWGRGYVSS